MSDAPVEVSFDPSTIKAIAFDAYGTLFNITNTDFHIAISRLLAEQEIEVEDMDAFFDFWVKAYGKAAVWAEARAASGGAAGGDLELNGPLPAWHSTHEIWRRQFGVAFEHYGMSGDSAAAADALRARLALADPYPDAHDTVEALAQRGYLLGLLSNADEDFLQSALSRARLRFSIIQTSESLRAYKPHRAIFEAFCLRARCEPHEVLYVGDSPIADVGGAQNAGLRTALVKREERPISERARPADVVVAQLADLVPILDGVRA